MKASDWLQWPVTLLPSLIIHKRRRLLIGWSKQMKDSDWLQWALKPLPSPCSMQILKSLDSSTVERNLTNHFMKCSEMQHYILDMVILLQNTWWKCKCSFAAENWKEYLWYFALTLVVQNNIWTFLKQRIKENLQIFFSRIL